MLKILFVISTNTFVHSLYTTKNASSIFETFKQKYNKTYKNINEEQNSYRNFVENLNKVTELNEVTKDNTTFFVVNQYADLNPLDIEEHYAISITPYEKITNSTEANIVGRMKTKDIDFTKLYDLYKTEELFKQYMEKNKRNVTKKLDRVIHYYRFVKSLVQLNRNQLNGEELSDLGDDADIVKEPNEYFY